MTDEFVKIAYEEFNGVTDNIETVRSGHLEEAECQPPVRRIAQLNTFSVQRKAPTLLRLRTLGSFGGK